MHHFRCVRISNHEHGSPIQKIVLFGADPEEEGAWQSLWPGESQDERCRHTPFSGDVAQDRENAPQTTNRCGAGARGDGGGDDARQACHQAPEDAGEKGQRAEYRGSDSARSNQHIGVRGGGETLAASDDDNNSGGSGESGGRNHSHNVTGSVQNVDRVLSPKSSSPGGVPSKKRTCTVDTRSFAASDARSGGTRGLAAAPAPALQRRPQCRSEPLTPRFIKRVLSPFWIPPLQEPPSPLITKPSRADEGQSRQAMCAQLGTGSGGDCRSENSVRVESGDIASSQALVCGGGGWSGAEKGGASAEFSAMLDEATDERVRQNMLHAQEIRDRYLRYAFSLF